MRIKVILRTLFDQFYYILPAYYDVIIYSLLESYTMYIEAFSLHFSDLKALVSQQKLVIHHLMYCS